jgi:nitrogen fixation NifU-like protein
MTSAAENQEQLRDLYRELILDHARNPRNFGKLDGATHQAEGINPLCGDKLRLYLKLDDADTVRAAAFEGSGCAISVASASLLAERVPGMTRQEALDFFKAIVSSLTGDDANTDPNLGKLAALQGVREFPARVKCATLSWHALASALNRDSAPATSE